MILIWIFIVTLAIPVIIFSAKAVEIKTGKRTFIPKILLGFDSFTVKVVLELKNLRSRLVTTVSFIISNSIPFYGKIVVGKIKITVKNKYYSTTKILRGYKNLEKNKGVVSTFLKKISEVEKANGDHKKGIE